MKIYFLFRGNFQKVRGTKGSCMCTISAHSSPSERLSFDGNKQTGETEPLKGMFMVFAIS